eukprot:TRINITY_DN14299_c0_g1_i1.p1 TRINITY_DN14299_c0_g1~~TRINITY_DN14299_c0_g1_i1.p1  ORF type:complete len:403 (+),score=70.98 TRINITY_DN14299_c0_g1_i1:95-1303(+)
MQRRCCIILSLSILSLLLFISSFIFLKDDNNHTYLWHTSKEFKLKIENEGKNFRHFIKPEVKDDNELKEAYKYGKLNKLKHFLFQHGNTGLGIGLIEYNTENISEFSFKEENIYQVVFKTKDWKKELVAFYLDRLLGFNKVPVVVPTRLTIRDKMIDYCSDDSDCEWKDLGTDESERRITNGKINGAYIQYIEQLKKVKVIDWYNCTDINTQKNNKLKYGISFDNLDHERVIFDVFIRHHEIPSVQCSDEILIQLSDLSLFDFIINNKDRWGFDQIYNLYANAEDGSFVYLDNGMAFDLDIKNQVLDFCKFSQSTYDKLLSFVDGSDPYFPSNLSQELISFLEKDFNHNESFLIDDENDANESIFFLTSKEFKAIDNRLIQVLTHIHHCIERYGNNNVIIKI